MSTIANVAFKIVRLTQIPSGTSSPIHPPILCMKVRVSNRTEKPLRIETDPDGVEYVTVHPGFEEVIELSALSQFRPKTIAFWIRPFARPSVDQPIVLLWS